MNKRDLQKMTGQQLVDVCVTYDIPVRTSNGILKESKSVVIERICEKLPKEKRGARNAARTKLKSVRVASGMSQEELANRTGLNVRTLQHYEQGSKDFDSARIDTILKVCITLNCTLSDIIESPDILNLISEYEKDPA